MEYVSHTVADDVSTRTFLVVAVVLVAVVDADITALIRDNKGYQQIYFLWWWRELWNSRQDAVMT